MVLETILFRKERPLIKHEYVLETCTNKVTRSLKRILLPDYQQNFENPKEQLQPKRSIGHFDTEALSSNFERCHHSAEDGKNKCSRSA